jgi:ferredoxin-NADP reductase
MAQPVRFQATVEQVIRHTDDVATYRLRSEKRLPAFAPGQFIHLTVEHYDPASFWPESRVFSVANAVADRRTVELTVSRQGAYTSRILDTLAPGSKVWGKGPYGEFTIGATAGVRRAVLIAGGTGVTPFCAFMDAVLSNGELQPAEVMLHYGARTADLLIYRDLADACSARFPAFRVSYLAETGFVEDVVIRRGRLDPRAIVAEHGDSPCTAYYLSGPKAMIDAFRAALIDDCGVTAERVLVDAWE